MSEMDGVKAIEWRGDHLLLLDQRVLPARVERLRVETLTGAADAIRDMVVRGAPAIGITAAYGAVLGAREARREAPETWHAKLETMLPKLAEARPTAVNLGWAVEIGRAHV